MTQLGSSLRTVSRSSPHRRVVVAGDRHEIARRVAAGGPAGGVGARVLGRESQQGGVVAGVESPERGRQINERGVVVRRVKDELSERDGRQVDPHARAVGVPGESAHRVTLQPMVEPAELGQDRPGPAARRASAEERPSVSECSACFGLERVVGVVIAAVENHRSNEPGMAKREDLGRIVAIGVPVDVNLVHSQSLQDVGQVVADGVCPVCVGGGAESAGAIAHRCRNTARIGETVVALQPWAVDRAGGARAAIVHHDQIVLTA